MKISLNIDLEVLECFGCSEDVKIGFARRDYGTTYFWFCPKCHSATPLTGDHKGARLPME